MSPTARSTPGARAASSRELGELAGGERCAPLVAMSRLGLGRPHVVRGTGFAEPVEPGEAFACGSTAARRSPRSLRGCARCLLFHGPVLAPVRARTGWEMGCTPVGRTVATATGSANPFTNTEPSESNVASGRASAPPTAAISCSVQMASPAPATPATLEARLTSRPMMSSPRRRGAPQCMPMRIQSGMPSTDSRSNRASRSSAESTASTGSSNHSSRPSPSSFTIRARWGSTWRTSSRWRSTTASATSSPCRSVSSVNPTMSVKTIAPAGSTPGDVIARRPGSRPTWSAPRASHLRHRARLAGWSR